MNCRTEKSAKGEQENYNCSGRETRTTLVWWAKIRDLLPAGMSLWNTFNLHNMGPKIKQEGRDPYFEWDCICVCSSLISQTISVRKDFLTKRQRDCITWPKWNFNERRKKKCISTVMSCFLLWRRHSNWPVFLILLNWSEQKAFFSFPFHLLSWLICVSGTFRLLTHTCAHH